MQTTEQYPSLMIPLLDANNWAVSISLMIPLLDADNWAVSISHDPSTRRRQLSSINLSHDPSTRLFWQLTIINLSWFLCNLLATDGNLHDACSWLVFISHDCLVTVLHDHLWLMLTTVTVISRSLFYVCRCSSTVQCQYLLKTSVHFQSILVCTTKQTATFWLTSPPAMIVIS